MNKVVVGTKDKSEKGAKMLLFVFSQKINSQQCEIFLVCSATDFKKTAFKMQREKNFSYYISIKWHIYVYNSLLKDFSLLLNHPQVQKHGKICKRNKVLQMFRGNLLTTRGLVLFV